MTEPDPQRGPHEYPSLENYPPPVDYPSAYPPAPGYEPPPAYPPPPSYPSPVSYGHPAPPPGPYPPPAPYGGYPPPFPDPYDPYRSAAPVGTNGMAIGSLICSLLGLLFCGVPSIVGVILGFIAMGQTKRTGQDGYGLALAGVIIGALTVVLMVVGFFLLLALGAVASTPSGRYT